MDKRLAMMYAIEAKHAFKKPKPTNGDCVRRMTDEQIAEWSENIDYGFVMIPVNEYTAKAIPVIEWLKQEALPIDNDTE